MEALETMAIAYELSRSGKHIQKQCKQSQNSMLKIMLLLMT